MSAQVTDDKISKTDRVMILREVQKLSWSQIAAQVGGTAGNASNLYQKARVRIIEVATEFLRSAEKERKSQDFDTPFPSWPSRKLWPISEWIEPGMTEDSLQAYSNAVSRVPANFRPVVRQRIVDLLAPILTAQVTEVAPVVSEAKPVPAYVRTPGFIEELKRNLEAAPDVRPETPEPRPLTGQPEPVTSPAPVSAPVKISEVPTSLAFRADGSIWTGGEF